MASQADRRNQRQAAGGYVRHARQAAGLAQYELARLLNSSGELRITQTRISQWELGKRDLEFSEALSVERLLGLRPGVLGKIAGYPDKLVGRAVSVEQVLLTDRRLDHQARQYLVDQYRAMLRASERLRG
jgi:transcriptional regulator with XRE-family HTH domain